MDESDETRRDDAAALPEGRRPARVGGQDRRDDELNRRGAISADDTGIQGEGEGAAELDAEIGRRETGAGRERRGTGLGAGLTQRPPD